MNVNNSTSDASEVPVNPDNLKRKGVSYDDLLPASHRTFDDDLQSPTATTTFLKKELGVDRLNHIHRWLWLIGRPMPPRPLYYQKAVGRNIIVHEQMDLHLVWDEQRIFLKPIPRYLLDQNFWHDKLRCKDRCAPVALHYQLAGKLNGRTPFGGDQERADVDHTECERCYLRRLATGFLITYTSLVSYEHDLDIANTSSLVPSEISWPQWRDIVGDWLTPEKKCDINPRYHYGELRLGRLDQIYRLTFRSPIRGYLYGGRTYRHFWNANLARVAAAFAYIIIVLTAMQVGLATDRLGKNDHFQRACYGFTVFSILAPLVFLGLLGVVFVGVVIFNLLETLKYKRKRFAEIDKRIILAATP